jgi:hypothetical protein
MAIYSKGKGMKTASLFGILAVKLGYLERRIDWFLFFLIK